jgi:sortase A
MSIYTYTKKKPSKIKNIIKIISLLLIFSGLAVISWVLYPILSFNILYADKFGEILSAIPDSFSRENIRQEIPNLFVSSNEDYTRANFWFPKAISVKNSINNLSSYFLTIEKLKINNAVVSIVNDDLTQNLVHFTGPMPGQKGNLVVFGHSTLPYLYNTKDYKTIFTKLPDMKKDDEIQIVADNVTYKYKIFEMKIVDPNNLTVLDQTTDDSYLTLITCVPPGTYFKRLVIKSRLENI